MCNTTLNDKNTLNFNKTPVLLALVSKDTPIGVDDYHQFLLDLGYDEWQKPENKSWCYHNMIDFVYSTYGELVAFATLIGKYNQQVCNGGHSQYYSNGYATGSGGCMSNHGDDISMHETLIGMYVKSTELSKFEWYEPLKDILNRFTKFSIDEERYETCSCSECGGSGTVIEDDGNHNDEEIDCPTCNGSGNEEVDNDNYGEVSGDEWSTLDDKYYEINEQVMKDLENVFKSKLV